MTAHYLLHEFRQIQRGEAVLIHAAAGGMGLLLVQWAKHLGAYVIGTVSNEKKAALAKEAGANEVINYREKNFEQEVLKLTEGRGVDLIIDGIGKSTFTKNLEAVAVRGNIVIYGAASGPAEAVHPNALQPRSVTISGGSLGNYIASRQELERRSKDVLAAIKQGWLKLRIDQTLPLAEAKKAHQLLEGRFSTGKIILKIAT
jgi:NADPH2:quinone reductase